MAAYCFMFANLWLPGVTGAGPAIARASGPRSPPGRPRTGAAGGSADRICRCCCWRHRIPFQHIRYGFNEIQSRWPLADFEREWLVNCHLIRTHAYEGQNGHPAPEGAHRDGVEFVIMGCVQKQNVVGGVSHVYEGNDPTPIHGVTLEPGQALLVEDRELFHMASPVLATAREGFRDMILMGFHHWSRGHYRADWRDSICDPTDVEHEL